MIRDDGSTTTNRKEEKDRNSPARPSTEIKGKKIESRPHVRISPLESKSRFVSFCENYTFAIFIAAPFSILIVYSWPQQMLYSFQTESYRVPIHAPLLRLHQSGVSRAHGYTPAGAPNRYSYIMERRGYGSGGTRDEIHGTPPPSPPQNKATSWQPEAALHRENLPNCGDHGSYTHHADRTICETKNTIRLTLR